MSQSLIHDTAFHVLTFITCQEFLYQSVSHIKYDKTLVQNSDKSISYNFNGFQLLVQAKSKKVYLKIFDVLCLNLSENTIQLGYLV